MTPHFDFRLKQQKPPLRPIGQIRIRINSSGDDKGVFVDDIRSEEEIDKNINMLIQELETIRKQAKRELRKQISMLKK